VRADYVEKPDDSKLIESAINGMLAGLDPHSSYMDSKSFRDMQVQTRGEFGGLGIEVTMEDGLIKVVAPIDETPAAKAGIMANDIITHLDDEPVQGLTLNQAVEKMRGPENSKIKLKIMRKGQDKPIEVSITRARIQVRSVRSRLEGDDVGFIRVTQFNEQTTEDLKKAITDLSTQAGDKLKSFIIDLRNNPGGLLDQAISVSDAFLEKGEIVSTRGRTAEEIQRFNARAGDLAKNKPVIVLINGGSASASEIVAGALQDHRRATVIGTRSFGKGSVQTIIPLGSGNGALRLTTARYFTRPDARSRRRVSRRTSRCCKRCLRSSKRAPTRVARLRCAATSRPKATSKPARSPISRRIRRTTRRSIARLISSAASRRTRLIRRIQSPRCRTSTARTELGAACGPPRCFSGAAIGRALLRHSAGNRRSGSGQCQKWYALRFTGKDSEIDIAHPAGGLSRCFGQRFHECHTLARAWVLLRTLAR
jgi:C-terminal peptidase prc